jgi:hypothetical protein
MRITQTIRPKSAAGDPGYLVETRVDGVLRRQTWTAGRKRDAAQVARQDRAEVEATVTQERRGQGAPAAQRRT